MLLPAPYCLQWITAAPLHNAPMASLRYYGHLGLVNGTSFIHYRFVRWTHLGKTSTVSDHCTILHMSAEQEDNKTNIQINNTLHLSLWKWLYTLHLLLWKRICMWHLSLWKWLCLWHLYREIIIVMIYIIHELSKLLYRLCKYMIWPDWLYFWQLLTSFCLSYVHGEKCWAYKLRH